MRIRNIVLEESWPQRVQLIYFQQNLSDKEWQRASSNILQKFKTVCRFWQRQLHNYGCRTAMLDMIAHCLIANCALIWELNFCLTWQWL